MEDDGNPVWEDIDNEEPDAILNARQQLDDKSMGKSLTLVRLVAMGALS